MRHGFYATRNRLKKKEEKKNFVNNFRWTKNDKRYYDLGHFVALYVIQHQSCCCSVCFILRVGI